MGFFQTDAQVITESLARSEAFSEVFDRHFAAVSAFLRRRTVESTADEITAQTFLVAFQKRDGFDSRRDSARPWLFGIATNLLRNDERSQGRELRAYLRLDLDREPDFSEASVARTDAVAARELLINALEELSADEADVLLLFAWADLSYDQIAEALEVPIGTVRSRLARARNRMQQCISDFELQKEGTPHG